MLSSMSFGDAASFEKLFLDEIETIFFLNLCSFTVLRVLFKNVCGVI